MKKEDFKKIIRLRSFWKIDRRKGDYKLFNGKRLSSYVRDLVDSQMELDSLGIKKDGDLCFCTYDTKSATYTLMPPFGENETCSADAMEMRVWMLVQSIVG